MTKRTVLKLRVGINAAAYAVACWFAVWNKSSLFWLIFFAWCAGINFAFLCRSTQRLWPDPSPVTASPSTETAD